MITETFSIMGILGSLAKIGVNITSNQKELLEWRFSDEGKKYYTLQETNKLYRAIEKGDTKLIDVIRKEKQKIINDLLKSSLSILLCFFMVSCQSVESLISKPQHLDSSALSEKEKTYQVEKQIVKTEEGKKVFDKDWYIVHKDIVKDMNDNQDQLIKQLQINKDLQEKAKKKDFIQLCVNIGTMLIILVLVILLIIKKKGKTV